MKTNSIHIIFINFYIILKMIYENITHYTQASSTHSVTILLMEDHKSKIHENIEVYKSELNIIKDYEWIAYFIATSLWNNGESCLDFDAVYSL